MQIRINNLPPKVTEEEVRSLFDDAGWVGKILLTDAGDPDNVVAWVDVAGSHAVADAVVQQLNGKLWKGRTLQAYAALFVK